MNPSRSVHLREHYLEIEACQEKEDTYLQEEDQEEELNNLKEDITISVHVVGTDLDLALVLQEECSSHH